MGEMRVGRLQHNQRSRRTGGFLFIAGLVTGVAVSFGGWWGVSNLHPQVYGEATVRTYFTDLAAGQMRAGESLAAGQALSALRFNTTHRKIDPVPVLDLRVLPEEAGQRVALDGVAVEIGGALPSLSQYQALVIQTSSGPRVADVWDGAAPADFGGSATSAAMLSTARNWLVQDAAGNLQASLRDLAGGALASAEQTGASASAWAHKVKIGAATWSVLGIDGGWGAVEGRWQATTPSGKTPVDLVLLGQMVDGRWRIIRVVTIS